MIVGITGVIGSGKSYIGSLLKKMGYPVYDSDTFVKEAYLEPQIINKIATTFQCVEKQKINKQKLKEILLRNPSNMEKLNAIIHPYVIEKIKMLPKKHNYMCVFVEIPLLFECHLQDVCDKTICVYRNETEIDQDLKFRDQGNYSFMQYLKQFQLDQVQKMQLADFIIENDRNLEKLQKSLVCLVDKLGQIR